MAHLDSSLSPLPSSGPVDLARFTHPPDFCGMTLHQLQDLPDSLQPLASWMIRRGAVSLHELMGYLGQSEAIVRSIVGVLVVRGWVKPLELEGELIYISSRELLDQIQQAQLEAQNTEADRDSEALLEPISELIPEPVPEASASESMPEPAPEAASELESEAASELESEAVPEPASEAVPEPISEVQSGSGEGLEASPRSLDDAIPLDALALHQPQAQGAIAPLEALTLPDLEMADGAANFGEAPPHLAPDSEADLAPDADADLAPDADADLAPDSEADLAPDLDLVPEVDADLASDLDLIPEVDADSAPEVDADCDAQLEALGLADPGVGEPMPGDRLIDDAVAVGAALVSDILVGGPGFAGPGFDGCDRGSADLSGVEAPDLEPPLPPTDSAEPVSEIVPTASGGEQPQAATEPYSSPLEFRELDADPDPQSALAQAQQNFEPSLRVFGAAPGAPWMEPSDLEPAPSAAVPEPLPVRAVLESEPVVTVQAGECWAQMVGLENLSDRPLQLQLGLDETSQPLVDWCTWPMVDLRLEPKQHQSVQFEFQIPERTFPCSYQYRIVVQAVQSPPPEIPEVEFAQDLPSQDSQARDPEAERASLEALVSATANYTPIELIQTLEVVSGQVAPPADAPVVFTCAPSSSEQHPVVLNVGDRLDIVITLRNTQTRPDRIEISCPDLQTSWYSVDYDLFDPELKTLELEPGREGKVQLLLHPPAETAAGPYPLRLRLLSANHPEVMLQEWLYVAIAPHYDLTAELHLVQGQILRQTSVYELKLINGGNTERELVLHTRTTTHPAPDLDYDLQPSWLIPAKTEFSTDLRIRAKSAWQRPWWGPGQTVHFAIDLEDKQNHPLLTEQLQGSVGLAPRPLWQPAALGIAAVGLMGLLATAIKLPSTPPAIVESQLEPAQPTQDLLVPQAEILKFQVNNQDAPSKIVIALDGKPLTSFVLSWEISAPANSEITMTPAPGRVPAKGMVTIKLKPEPGKQTITLTVKPPKGNPVSRNVTFELFGTPLPPEAPPGIRPGTSQPALPPALIPDQVPVLTLPAGPERPTGGKPEFSRDPQGQQSGPGKTQPPNSGKAPAGSPNNLPPTPGKAPAKPKPVQPPPTQPSNRQPSGPRTENNPLSPGDLPPQFD
jgi:hypothetical protein